MLVEAGLPEPRLNVWVQDTIGREIARVDMLFEEQRVVIEDEGDHHRTDKRQFRKDITRPRMLQELGYVVIRVIAADLATPRARAQLVALVARALAR